MKNICLAFIAALMMTVTTAHAADFDKGVAAYGEDDYPTALVEFSELAEEGHAGAQTLLALMYSNGKGVAQDYATAVKWYTLAAEQGNAHAQINLGGMYSNGKGVAQDYAAAVKWYTLAAKQGHANAQSNLGVMYYSGYGVLEDFVLAHMWVNIGAANGDKIGAKFRGIVAEEMTQADIATAQRMARECMASNYESCGY